MRRAIVLASLLVAATALAVGTGPMVVEQPAASGSSSSGGIGCAIAGGVLYSSTGDCEAAFSYDSTTDTLSVTNLSIGSTFAGTDIEMLSGGIDVLGVLQLRGEGPSGTGFSLDGPMDVGGYDITGMGTLIGPNSGNNWEIYSNGNAQFANGDVTIATGVGITTTQTVGGYTGSFFNLTAASDATIYRLVGYGGGDLLTGSNLDMQGYTINGASLIYSPGVELADNVNSADHDTLYICTDTANLTMWPGNAVNFQNGGNINMTPGGSIIATQNGGTSFEVHVWETADFTISSSGFVVDTLGVAPVSLTGTTVDIHGPLVAVATGSLPACSATADLGKIVTYTKDANTTSVCACEKLASAFGWKPLSATGNCT